MGQSGATDSFAVTQYGFDWGPFEVERSAHIEGRGWVLTVRVGVERLEITTSEKGRSGMKLRHVLWSSTDA